MNKKIYGSVGIDQSLTHTGLTLIDEKGKIIQQKTLETINTKHDVDRCLKIVVEIDNFLLDWPIYNKSWIEGGQIVFTREDHGFQLHGRAQANLLLAGRIDQFVNSAGGVFNINYFIVPDRDWKKKFDVQKPRRSKANGLTDAMIRDQYLKNYPKYGSNIHEVDSFFLAYYGLFQYIENLKKAEDDSKEIESEEL